MSIVCEDLRIDQQTLQGTLLKQEPLADYVSWRTGGPADYLYLPKNLSDLQQFLRMLPQDIPLTWIGLGSNLLVRDRGIEGVVVITQGALQQMQCLEDATIRAESGVASAQLARFAARHGAAGLEFLAGIPGTVGGVLQMNAGCYGSETWQFVKRVETINRAGLVTLRDATEFKAFYRHVIKPVTEEWFVAGHFEMQPGDKQTALNNIKTLLAKRNAAQPTGTANCGSVFRNPEGDYAARLIESCGLKGKTIGGAAVSTKHANFIINEGQAKAADIEHLIQTIAATVLEKTGVRLIPEVCIIGRA